MTQTAPHVAHIMGTVVSFDIRDERPAEAAINAACHWLHRVDAIFSTYRHDSAISRLDQRAVQLHDVHPDVRAVLKRCAQLHRQTDGLFDIRVNGHLDPSGYVKGWATQRAAEILRLHGLKHFAINAGGDVVARGSALPTDGWHIGIRHPTDIEAFASVAVLRDGAIATSARYERGDHVPQRRPGAALDSVTVVASDLGVADAWSTALLAAGTAGLELINRTPEIEAFCIAGEQTFATADFPDARQLS